MEFDELSNRVIRCALEVHRHLGPGLLESAYRRCLAHELALAGISFETEKPIAMRYKEEFLDCGLRLDLLIQNELIVELKSVDKLLAVHQAQLLTYMKIANVQTGMLMNFNSRLLRDGLRRIVL
jgi:GxxExxY protein